MRRQRKSLWSGWGSSVLVSVLAGALCIGAGAVLTAAIVYFFMKDMTMIRAFAGVSLAAGAYIAAYICGKYRRRKGLVCGIVCGALLYAVINLLAIIILGEWAGIKKLLLLTVFGAAGGVAGVNSKRPKKLRDQ